MESVFVLTEECFMVAEVERKKNLIEEKGICKGRGINQVASR